MAMNLKEAFQYRNVLNSHFWDIKNYICNPLNGIGKQVTELHKRSEANPEAEDETRLKTFPRTYDYPAEALVSFMQDIVDELHRLHISIELAKSGTHVDSDIACNNYYREMGDALNRLGYIRTEEKTATGTGFKFNAEGNQVSYVYDIVYTTTPDLDVNRMRKLGRNYKTKANETSTNIDRTLIESCVYMEPKFSITDNFNEAIVRYMDEMLGAELSEGA